MKSSDSTLHHRLSCFSVFSILHFQGYNIISVLSLEIVPIMELLASMKSHSVPEDINVSSAHTYSHLILYIYLYIFIIYLYIFKLRKRKKNHF